MGDTKMPKDSIPLKFNTLDIDTNNKEVILRITKKINLCSCLSKFEIKPSFQKGVHIKLMCLIECELCRIVYDDSRRYALDQLRPEFSRNVLFDSKEFFKNGVVLYNKNETEHETK
jgi:hypothetical protein